MDMILQQMVGNWHKNRVPNLMQLQDRIVAGNVLRHKETIGYKLPQDAINPAHGSILRLNSPSSSIIFINEFSPKNRWRSWC